MGLTVKSQKYSFFLFKILFFLIFLVLNNAKALVIEDLKDGLLYQRFNDEFHFKTNIEVSTNIEDYLYAYEYSKKFIAKNLGNDLNKNLVAQSIAVEYLLFSKTDYEIKEIDINYIKNLKKNFIEADFEFQCSTGNIVTSTLTLFGIMTDLDEFKGEIYDCIQYISTIEYASLLLTLISNQPSFNISDNINIKNLGYELGKLEFNEDNFNDIDRYNLGSCDANKLYKFKSYSTLIYFYRNQNNTEKVLENYNKANKIQNMCSGSFESEVLKLELHYRFFMYQESRTNTLSKKIDIFNEFDQKVRELYKGNLDDLFFASWYFDFYLVNAMNEFELENNLELLKERMDFVILKSKYSQNSQEILGLVADLKELYYDQPGPTEGLIARYDYKSSRQENTDLLWENIKQHEANNSKDYSGLVAIIDNFEIQFEELNYPVDKYLIEYKYLCLYLDKKYTESIDYIFDKGSKYVERSFNQQGINFFSNSQNPEIIEIIEDLTVKIIDSLFVLQYSDGYKLEYDKRKNTYPEEYNEVLPRALNMLLYLGQISDLNEANHSIKYLKLKDELLNASKKIDEGKIPKKINNTIKEIYQNEKEYLSLIASEKFNLNQINILKNKIDNSYQNLYNSDFWQKIVNLYPEANLNYFQPTQLFELQTKLRFDEQLIYFKEFKETIFAIGISHNELDWMKVDEEDYLEIKKSIDNFKEVI